MYLSALKRVHDEDVAKDIVQEIFISLWERREHVIIQGSLQGYLLSAVKFKVIDYYRKSIILKKHEEDFYQLAELHYTLDHAEPRDLESQLSQAIESLPGKMRKIFEMSRQESKSIDEISTELNISSQTVKNQLTTATKLLRKHLTYLVTFVVFIIQ